ncbi:MAG: four helix bundle protein, partial [Gemmatimonadaceae bacterium]
VWQKAHALAMGTYQMAKKIRRTRDVAWRAQTIRAALSIPTNIVEGRRQTTDKEFARFLRIALNSACELEYHVMVGRDIGVINEKEAEARLRDIIEVRRMLHGLLNKLAGRPRPTALVPSNASMKAEKLRS